MGIDMATRGELLASEASVEAIRGRIGADSLGYISIEGLVHAIGHEKDELCMACLTGEYPLDIEDEKYRDAIQT
jgi:amidophosphoribosyltransferase